MASDYEPEGYIECLDVFHAIPLKVAAAPREEWLDLHLSKWKDFSQTEPRYHPVGGAHYTMLGPEFVGEFALRLEASLRARGL